jgi:hypothetical protein
MRVVIIYESLYGNTHTIADAIARGLWRGNDVSVVPVGQAHADLLEGADLVVVGGPTHAHSMSRASTRQAAAERAGRPDNLLTLDAGVTADGPGIREWLGALGQPGANGALCRRIRHPAGRTRHCYRAGLQRHRKALATEWPHFDGSCRELPCHPGKPVAGR